MPTSQRWLTIPNQDHHPLLTGLEPDTVHYGRLQGVGPDGTLYQCEEYTFEETRVTRLGFWIRTMGSSAQIEQFEVTTERFDVVNSSGGNTGAVEIEVYGQQP